MAGALIRISGALSESQLSGSYVWSVVFWTGLGIVVADGLVLLYFGHLWVEGQLLPADELADLLIFAAAWGSTSSAYMALQRARARRRFDQVSDQRDEFAFLNSILRHNVSPPVEWLVEEVGDVGGPALSA